MRRLKTWILPLLASSLAQAQPPVGRPILFVHGFCDTAASWGALETSVINYVTGLQPSLYTNSVPWTAYYDSNSQSVKAWPNGQDFLSTVPSSTRFFSINFFDPSSSDFSSINADSVAQVSILNKADELAQVIQAITTLTRVKDVIIVAHSQGGLDARAYIENLAIPSIRGTCSDQNPNPYACLSAPSTYYTQDIAKLITLDTPHGGVQLANWGSWVNLPIVQCFLANTLDRRELEESSFLLGTLNSRAGNPPPGLDGNGQHLTIASIQSYTSPGFSATSGPDGDGAVTFQEQSIQNVVTSWPSYYDVASPDDFGSFLAFYGSVVNIYPLHLLTNLGTQPLTTDAIQVELDKVLLHGSPAQTTSIDVHSAPGVSYSLTGPTSLSGTGPDTFYNVPTGAYTLTYPGGALQQTLGVDHTTGDNNWNLTFTIPLTASSLTVLDKVTSNVTGIANGLCSTPRLVTGFTVTSPQVWLYFEVIGARAGDSVQMNFVRPDGTLYTSLNSLVSSTGQNGYECFSYQIPISGASAASYPGIWKIQVFWDQANAPLFTLNFGISPGNENVRVLDKVTSNVTGLVNSSCITPPAVTSFTTSSPQVWLYFDVTGTNAGDTAQIDFSRPDGVLYASLNSFVSSPGQNGYQCFSYSIPIDGTSAASFPGTWTVWVFWDSTDPLFTLNFTLSAATQGPPPTITSLSPPSVTAGGPSFTLTVNGSTFAAGSTVQWNATALPTTIVSATQLQASVASGLIASSGRASITVSSGGSVSQPISFTISPTIPPPAVTIGGVTNAASFAKDANGDGAPVAPGSLVSIFGTYPGATLATATAPFPLTLGSVSVTFNGIPAPLSAVVPNGTFPLIDAQVPFEVLSAAQTSGTVSLVVTVNGASSTPRAIPIVSAAPGVFTIPPNGQGNVILAFVDPVDNTAKISAPASAGASIGYPTAPIPLGQPGYFYATGLGAMTPSVIDGSGDPTVTHFANVTPIVMVGGVSAEVQFAGQAPGYPGVNQINIVIPNNAPTGNAVPLQIQTADGKIISTPGATIAIRSGASNPLLNLTGTWSGNAADSSGPGLMTWNLTQSGTAVSGTVTASTPLGTFVFNGTLSGSLSGLTLIFSIDVPTGGISGAPNCSATLSGSTTSLTSSSMTGTYSGSNSCTGPFSNGSFTLSLQPPSTAPILQSLTLTSTSLIGGGSTTATVTLSSPAPTGGIQVTLSSSNSIAQVPKTVTIASGQSRATFTIATGTVASTQTTTITASIGTSTTTAVLTVAPVASGAVTVLSVTGNCGDQGALDPNYSFLADWSQTTAFYDVNIAIAVTTSGAPVDDGTTVLAFLTNNGAGPGTILSNEIARASFVIPSGAPDNTLIQVFSGLVLGPGHYFLTISSPQGYAGGWCVEPSSPVISSAAGVVEQNSYILGFSTYPPAGGPVQQWGNPEFSITGVPGTAPSIGVAIQSLMLSPNSVTQGDAVAGTVTLSAPAPNGGVKIALASNNQNASAPAVVEVPAGQNNMTFPVTTTGVTSSQAATITATLGSSTAADTVTISFGTGTNGASVQGQSFKVTGRVTFNGQSSSIELRAVVIGSNGSTVGYALEIDHNPIGVIPAIIVDGVDSFAPGNDITLNSQDSNPTITGGWTNPDGSVVTVMAVDATLTFASPTEGAAVTGTLVFNGLVIGTISGTLTFNY